MSYTPTHYTGTFDNGVCVESSTTPGGFKPTVAQEAIETADGYLNNAVLPTYSELLAALRALDWACTGVRYMEEEYTNEVEGARAVLARHDKTIAGNFGA